MKMPLAVCVYCNTLRRIESRGYKPGERRIQVWIIEHHPAIGEDTGGKACDGSGRTV